MRHSFYREYFEAAKNILKGTPVENLEEIRKQCNEKFLKAISSGALEVPEDSGGYAPEVIIAAFVADAENKILLKEISPDEAYKGFSGLDPADLRRRGRKILERVIRQHLK